SLVAPNSPSGTAWLPFSHYELGNLVAASRRRGYDERVLLAPPFLPRIPAMRARARAFFVLAFVVAAPAALDAAKFDTEQDKDGVTVKVDGQLFTRYLIKSGAKPILWPVIGPTGKEMTRAWPMRDDEPGKKNDHVHQRSFWFTHGNVNGVSFWDEQPGH